MERYHPVGAFDPKHGLSPDFDLGWSIFKPPHPPVWETPEGEGVLSVCIDYGVRPDGSRQIGLLYGSIGHTYSPSSTVYARMLQDWGEFGQWYQDEQTDIAGRAVLLTEGRVRNPPVDRTGDPVPDAPTIMRGYGELGAYEYLARHAGVELVDCAEPDADPKQNFLLQVGYRYGFGPLICYLGERMIWQACEVRAQTHTPVALYVYNALWTRYSRVMHAADAQNVDTGTTGFKRYLNSVHPEYESVSIEELTLDTGFIQLTHDETRHTVILRKPEAARNDIERVALVVNRERDRELIRRYIAYLAVGYDVFVTASAVHLIPILRAARQSQAASSVESFGAPFGLAA